MTARTALVAAAVLLAAAAGAVAVPIPTKHEYLTAVSATCRSYSKELARIPAPANITAYGDVVESISRALPLLRREEAAMKRVAPPRELRGQVAQMFVLHERSVVELEKTLVAANRRDAGGVALGLGRFAAARDRSQAFARQLGVRCS
jgi:hypothetical protein